MKIFLRRAILLLFFICVQISAETVEKFHISTNSPVKAGEVFKLTITPPASDEQIKYWFNSETHIVSPGMKVFSAIKHVSRYAKKLTDTEACFGKSVAGVSKYQGLVSIKFPQDDKTYSVWVRAKGGALCLRNSINGKSKELSWNWTYSDSYTWRLFGNYTKKQIGLDFSFMTSKKKPFATIDCVLLTTDKSYKPKGKCVPPNVFSWQTDGSSIGTHKMPLKIKIGNKIIEQKISVTVSAPSFEPKIITNSPIKAGEKLKVEIIAPPTNKMVRYQFNGETHASPPSLKVFNGSEYACNGTKVLSDTKACFGQSVVATGKYQSLISVKFPQDDKTYSIWLRVKGGGLCLRNSINGRTKELKWNWQVSKNYIWRCFGNYTKEQIGPTLSIMAKGIKHFTAIDCLVLTDDKNYIPKGKSVPPNVFYWQTDVSSVGTHQMLVTIKHGKKIIERNITFTVSPASSEKSPDAGKLSKQSIVNIPLGKSAELASKYPDFDIFNQSYRDFFSKAYLGITFPVKGKFIALRCEKYKQLPPFAIIPVKKKLTGLAFLHTEYWQGDVGTQVAFYRVKYKDSITVDIPLHEEFEIAGSLRDPETKNAIQVFKAWSKLIDFHISLLVWKNPHPDKEIESITFSNLLSRYSKEENKLIPLNVTSMSSQILLNIVGLKTPEAVEALLAQKKYQSPNNQKTTYITVNYKQIIGKISPYLFSTNETGVMNTETTEFKDYQEKMSQIGCKMFRLHSGWNLQKVYPKGIDGPRHYKNLDIGIRNILRGHSERVIMICINIIPKYIDPLKEKDRKHFAALCVDLFKHFKKENIPVKYWEIYNEVYFTGVKQDRSLWKMYNLAAKSLKQLDSTIKVGGYAPCWPTISGISDFYKYCHQNIDFISWHKYPTGSAKTSDWYIMNSANAFSKDVRAIRKMVQKITPGKKIEYALTEYNINWNWKPHDPRQANNKGAVWLASVFYHLINSKADIALTWHSRSGGTFGLLSHTNEIRPTAELLYLCNRYLNTNYVASKTNDKLLECLSFIQRGKHIGILLINKSNQVKQIKISALNLPDLPINPFEGNALEYTIGAKGLIRQKSSISKKMKLVIKPYELKMIIAKLKTKK